MYLFFLGFESCSGFINFIFFWLVFFKCSYIFSFVFGVGDIKMN